MGARGAVVDNALAVADAVLYEGYLLYPYRRSSGKNRIRWQFGVLLPPAWAQAHGLVDTGVAGSAESWWQQTECLLDNAEDPVDPEGTEDLEDAAATRIRLRFLQLQHRSVEAPTTDGTHQPVDRLRFGDRTEVAFDEAVPREFEFEVPVAELLLGDKRFDIDVPGGEDVEPSRGEPVGRVVRRRWPLSASVVVSATARGPSSRLLTLRVLVENRDHATPPDTPREFALRRCLLATHTLLSVSHGTFVSLLDPPPWAREAARECRNVHTFPVLAGERGTSDVVLSSPIILYDHPRIAPESPGELHDSTEIDEILSLRTLTLAEGEKREVRSTDPRAAALLDRVEA